MSPPVQITDPFTGQPFPGNIIPTAVIPTVYAWPVNQGILDGSRTPAYGYGVGAGYVAKISLASEVSLSSTSLPFGPQNVETPSAPLTETITNTGTDILTISTTTISGTNAGDFAKSDDTCTGATITPDSDCSVKVTFTPSATGSRSASLSFTDNASNSPQTVTLTGTGWGPTVHLSAGSLTFCALETPYPTSISPQTVTLSNSGNAPLNFSSIAASGDFAQSNSCLKGVAAGANCAITVTFRPPGGARGVWSGSLSISDNAHHSPQTVSLIGIVGEFFPIGGRGCR